MSSKTDVSVNNFYQLQKAEYWGKIAPILYRKLRRPFREHGGLVYGTKNPRFPDYVYTWLALPRNQLFIPANGLGGCQRPEEKEAVRRHITKKCGSPLHRCSHLREQERSSGLPHFLISSP